MGPAQGLYFLQQALALSVSGQQLWEGYYHFCLREGSRTFQGHSFDGWEQENRFLGEGRKPERIPHPSICSDPVLVSRAYPDGTVASFLVLPFQGPTALSCGLAWVLFKIVSKVGDKDRHRGLVFAGTVLFVSGG